MGSYDTGLMAGAKLQDPELTALRRGGRGGQKPSTYSDAAPYIERNPLRASLVERAELWPWSSLCPDGENRQGFSHREADAKSLLDEAVRRGMGEQRGTNGDGGSGEGG
jgi:hypothetical protein